MELQEIMLAVIGGLLTALSAWFWNDKKDARAELAKTKEQIENLRMLTATIENKLQHYTTQAEVREMLRDGIEPVRQDQREIKSDLKEIINLISSMSRELAVINALNGKEGQ